jgi:hypothetical protein
MKRPTISIMAPRKGMFSAVMAQLLEMAGIHPRGLVAVPDCPIAFRKSTHSAGMGQCVEVGTQSRGPVAVRDSQDADGTWISVSSAGWREFVSQVKLGGVRTR